MSHAIQHAYNLAPSLADQLTSSAMALDQGRGWINLHDLNAQNVSTTLPASSGYLQQYLHLSPMLILMLINQCLLALQVIQHDASFTRPDIAFCPDQSYPHPDLVDDFLSHASNGKSLSLGDISYFSALRRSECKRKNGQYSVTWSFLHKFFGRRLLRLVSLAFPCLW
jgi:hypothetical protein